MDPDAKLGIITANSRSLDQALLEAMSIPLSDQLKLIGLQDETYFRKGILDEIGVLDTEKVEKEVIARCALAREESRGVHVRTDWPHQKESRTCNLVAVNYSQGLQIEKRKVIK
jgi:aspartate oxidase